MGGTNVTRGLRSGGFSVMGDVPEIREVQAMRIVEGRFLNRLDLEEKRKVAVIGSRVREVLFETDEHPVGASIEIQGVYFTVVGVFASVQSGERAERDVQTVYLPFTTFQHAFNYGDRVGWLAVTSIPGVPASQVQEKVLTLLKSRHRVSPSDRRAFGSWNMEEEYNRIQGLFGGINALVWIVGLGTLSAGVIGVSNIMLIIVRERTKEIGIRRAIGATPASITVQVIVESVMLTGVAGYAGLVAGVVVLEAINGLLAAQPAGMFRDPGVDFATALTALAVLGVSGVVAGLLPAWRAVQVNPVAALHAE
jgi:putative ABC transport system permease protein